MLRAIHDQFIPNKIILLADGGAGQTILGKHLEFIRTVKPNKGKATAHVCENYVCQLPTTDIPAMKSQLTKTQNEQPPRKG
ncbi:MAG: hypothetical protein HY735_03175 [Verrucomicrobia bacterium]|nr:hypothetical protein [Verrucomicrobiota bacterium]